MTRSSKFRKGRQHTNGKEVRKRALQKRKGRAKLDRRYALVDTPSPSSKDDSSANDDSSISSSESESSAMKPAAKKMSK